MIVIKKIKLKLIKNIIIIIIMKSYKNITNHNYIIEKCVMNIKNNSLKISDFLRVL